MEKVCRPLQAGARPRHSYTARIPLSTALLIAVVLLTYASYELLLWIDSGKSLSDARLRRNGLPGTPFNWSDITPSPTLKYHECYEDLQCARLELPLDYQDPKAAARVAIAIIRRPAKVPVTDVRYGGAIITNPGGPGGSGVAQ